MSFNNNFQHTNYFKIIFDDMNRCLWYNIWEGGTSTCIIQIRCVYFQMYLCVGKLLKKNDIQKYYHDYLLVVGFCFIYFLHFSLLYWSYLYFFRNYYYENLPQILKIKIPTLNAKNVEIYRSITCLNHTLNPFSPTGKELFFHFRKRRVEYVYYRSHSPSFPTEHLRVTIHYWGHEIILVAYDKDFLLNTIRKQ